MCGTSTPWRSCAFATLFRTPKSQVLASSDEARTSVWTPFPASRHQPPMGILSSGGRGQFLYYMNRPAPDSEEGITEAAMGSFNSGGTAYATRRPMIPFYTISMFGSSAWATAWASPIPGKGSDGSRQGGTTLRYGLQHQDAIAWCVRARCHVLSYARIRI